MHRGRARCVLSLAHLAAGSCWRADSKAGVGERWAPSGGAVRTSDTVGRQWASGIEAVAAGCETVKSAEADRSVVCGGHGLIS